MHNNEVKIRETDVAGELYPDNKKELAELLKKSLDREIEDIDNPLAIITPYATYKYAINAYAASYSQVINKNYDLIVIISPVHKIAFQGIALTDYDFFNCPLGNLKIDKEAGSLINSYNPDFLFYDNKFHSFEISCEMQLPFIYHIFGDKVSILPVIIGESNTKFTLLLANAFKSLIEKTGKKILFIATTNLCTNTNYHDAKKIDNKFIDVLLEFHPDHLGEELAMGQIQAHGGSSIITIMRLAKMLNRSNVRILELFNSGDVKGEKMKVDSYISSIIW